MKIALSGPAGTGKTTLMNDFDMDPQKKSIEDQVGPIVQIPEVVRALVKKNGMQINDDGTLETELSVLSAHINNLLTIPNFISDRCLIDNTIYTKMSKDFPGKKDYVAHNDFLIEKLIEKYDLIFYIQVEFHPPEDGVRNLKEEFYQESIKRFEETYADLVKKYNNIVILRGSRTERMGIIYSEIEKLLRRQNG